VYGVEITIKRLHRETWDAIRARCAGSIGSVLELLQGRLSDEVMAIVTHRREGLFPMPDEIQFQCDCPDWASMCKHVAAVLYGIGARLDEEPALLFRLRGVEAEELIQTEIDLGETAGAVDFEDDALSELFGVEIDAGESAASPVSLNSRRDSGSPLHERRDSGYQQDDRMNGGYPLDENGLILFSGAAIRDLRKRFGLSQTAFAERIRTSLYYLRKWENNPAVRPELDLSIRVELETLVKFGID